MSDCQIISELLPQYIGGSTTPRQNSQIVMHLASCPECRAEAALWLSVNRQLAKVRESEAPIELYEMLKKVPDNRYDLVRLISPATYTTAFDTIGHVFAAAKATYKLASLLIY